MASSTVPAEETIHAVINVENYVWHGLPAYLTGDKNWSTGRERPAGLPYRPVEAPDEAGSASAGDGGETTTDGSGMTDTGPGGKRKHGHVEAGGNGEGSGGKKQKTN